MSPQTKNDICYETVDPTLKAKAENFDTTVLKQNRKWEIVWRNVILFTLLHTGALYGIYIAISKKLVFPYIFGQIYGIIGGLGITAGAHRLWAHKAYKARLPLRILLVAFNCIALQDSVIHWARDHRMHHKYSETDADPHNATRGFFFAHMGWLLVRKHPKLKAKGHTVDVSDLRADPVLRFQHKYYKLLVLTMCFAVPTYIATLWNVSTWDAFFVCGIVRYVLTLHFTWLVNSAAHIWGNRPYDKTIHPAENKTVAVLALGEGFHNYHHTFPWDYKTSELGKYSMNFSTCFIDAMAKIGWAYDLKTVPADVLEKRIQRTGDGTHEVSSGKTQ